MVANSKAVLERYGSMYLQTGIKVMFIAAFVIGLFAIIRYAVPRIKKHLRYDPFGYLGKYNVFSAADRKRRIAADTAKQASNSVLTPMQPLNGSSSTGAPVPAIPGDFESSGIGFPVRSEAIPSISRSQISKVQFADTLFKPTLDLSEDISGYDISSVHKNADIKANGMVLQPIVDPDNTANGRLKMEFNDYEKYPDLQYPIRISYDNTRVYDGQAIPKAEPSTAANPPMKMVQSGTVYPLSLNNLPTNDFFD